MLIGAFDIYFQCLHNRSFHVTKNRLSSVQLKLDIAYNAILTWIHCSVFITQYNAGTLDTQMSFICIIFKSQKVRKEYNCVTVWVSPSIVMMH